MKIILIVTKVMNGNILMEKNTARKSRTSQLKNLKKEKQ